MPDPIVTSAPNDKIALIKMNNGAPFVEIEHALYPLPDTPLSRWWVKAAFQRVLVEDACAEEWFEQYHPLRLDPPNIPYLKSSFRGDYQKLAVKRMEFGSCCLWFHMGLGKTFITIARCLQLYCAGKANTFLVICPPSVFITWKEQLQEHIDPSANTNLIFAHGPQREKRLAALKTDYNSRPTFVITSYETNAICWEALSAIRFQVIIFDEVSKIKNMPRARTKAAHSLVRAQSHAYVYELSGTPSTKNVTGYYSLYELIFPGATGFRTFKDFEDFFSIKTEFMKIKMPPNYTSDGAEKTITLPKTSLPSLKPYGEDKTYLNLGYRFAPGRMHGAKIIPIIGRFNKIKPNLARLPRLNQITRNLAYCLKKEQVAKDLPPKTFIRRFIDMSEEQKKLYKQILTEKAAEFKTVKFQFANMFSPHIKLHQVANGYLKLPNGELHILHKQPKLDELDLILDETPETKIIIWSPFRPQIEMVMQHFKKQKLTAWEIHGGVPINEREEVLRQFRATEPPCYLVANPEVAGMGLNLEFSHYQIFLTNWFRPDTRLQAIDRQHRITQTNPVTVIDIIVNGTLEKRILDALSQEIQVENKILVP